jgi:myo-inositol 2-dehydrogenase / D-chiro-inositol 1-dehydrogenase
MPQPNSAFDRRMLLKTSAAAASSLALARFAYAGGSDRLRVGLIGCGGRGRGAVEDVLTAGGDSIQVVALGDAFADRVTSARDYLQERFIAAEKGAAFDVPNERCFSGFDAYTQVLDADLDLVLLATPPHFRPQHLAAAIARGVNVFMEKPVAVDAPGVRSVLASGEAALAQGLSIVAGTQRRHQRSYQEAMQRIHAGAIGEIVAGQCWWNQGGLWMNPRQTDWSDMEWQLKNWLYFTWLSGDHIVEQHIHNLDVINWALRSHPVSANASGGRQSRTDPAYGHAFDHFAVELEYPNGVLIQSHCRQIDGCSGRIAERLVGTQGVADPNGWIQSAGVWRFEGEQPNPYVQEHVDLLEGIRSGEPLNEARQVAESTLTAILGRTAAYTGQTITWEQMLASEQRWGPSEYALGDLAVDPVARPGETQFS